MSRPTHGNNLHQPPLTNAEAGYPDSPPVLKDKHRAGRYLICSVCHWPGGTLIANNDDGTYKHASCV